ncbi:flagellar protein FlaG [Paenibacillus sp. HJGM_3]|uniref:flagellar protein FlaG n=1 Tax=Paenibacillus sp. HJGM_3 TaxID=3379816 RepID=UPI003859DD00
MESNPVGMGAPKVPSAGNEQHTPPPIHTTQELKRAEVQGESVPISEEQMVKAINKAIKAAEGATTELNFSVHKVTKQIMVKVLEKDTGRVIREIPPEKMQDFVAKLWEMAGILVDERR